MCGKRKKSGTVTVMNSYTVAGLEVEFCTSVWGSNTNDERTILKLDSG